MNREKLLKKMEENGVKLPHEGTGKNGRIINDDLEYVLGDYFARLKYPNPVDQLHLKMRRQMVPMKAFRYDKLDVDAKESVLISNPDWYGEEKFDGWRMIITFIPGDGFRFWGGNISDVDFLPKDYTQHISLRVKAGAELYLSNPKDKLFEGEQVRPTNLGNALYIPCAFDCEALCYDNVLQLDGSLSNGTLQAVGAILGSDPPRALELQLEHELEFKCFDYAPAKEATCELEFDHALEHRTMLLSACLHLTKHLTQFSIPNRHYKDKSRALTGIWKRGGEGMILKNKNVGYAPGSRLKTHSIKVKRTMSGEIGDNIDAFISGYVLTEEWTLKGLIGGLKLSVYITGEDVPLEHHIATVSSMPDMLREQFTANDSKEGPTLAQEIYNKVVEVDGQELSSKNKKLMHARADWTRGFRPDKRPEDCTLQLQDLELEKF